MYIELGKIVGVWGVKGWVKLHSYTRNRIDIADYSSWWLKSNAKAEPIEYKVQQCREQGQGVVALFKEIEGRDQAVALNGFEILVRQSDLPKLPAGEYYWQQLIGLTVKNIEGLEMGIIDSIVETGANDVLVVTSNEPGKEEVLIPYTDVVHEVNLAEGTMLVDWDPSYLDS